MGGKHNDPYQTRPENPDEFSYRPRTWWNAHRHFQLEVLELYNRREFKVPRRVAQAPFAILIFVLANAFFDDLPRRAVVLNYAILICHMLLLVPIAYRHFAERVGLVHSNLNRYLAVKGTAEYKKTFFMESVITLKYLFISIVPISAALLISIVLLKNDWVISQVKGMAWFLIIFSYTFLWSYNLMFTRWSLRVLKRTANVPTVHTKDNLTR